MTRTLNRLAVKRRRDLPNRVRNRPVPVPDLDEAHRRLRRGPRRRDRVRLAAADGGVGRRADDERLRAHRGEAVDVRAEVQLDDVARGERLRARAARVRGGEVRDGVVYGYARGEGDACSCGLLRIVFRRVGRSTRTSERSRQSVVPNGVPCDDPSQQRAGAG